MSKHINRRRLISPETTGLRDKIYSRVPMFVIRFERPSRNRNHDQWNLILMFVS